MIIAATGFGVFLGAAATSPTTALAGVVFDWTLTSPETFSGSECGSVSTVETLVDKNAYNVTVDRPTVGTPLISADTENEVATVTAISTRKSSSGNVYAIVAATGSGDPCDFPYDYADEGWTTEEIPIKVSFTRLERVWFNEFYAEGDETWTRERPRWIHEGTDSGWQKIHWYKWGKATAIGRGNWSYVEKWSGGSKVHRYPVRLVFDHVGDCYGRLRYKRVTTTFLHGRPSGSNGAGPRRHRVWRKSLTCSHGIY